MGSWCQSGGTFNGAGMTQIHRVRWLEGAFDHQWKQAPVATGQDHEDEMPKFWLENSLVGNPGFIGYVYSRAEASCAGSKS